MSITVTVRDVWLDTATSTRPSPSKSAAASPFAPVCPVGSGELGSGTQPAPERSRTEIDLLPWFATARSA